MRRLLLLTALFVSLLAMPRLGWAAWALQETQVNFDDGVNHTSQAAPAANIATGSLIVVTVGWEQGGSVATLTADCTNCGSDTFTQAKNINSTGDGYQLAVFYKCNATANASYTITAHTDIAKTFSRIIVEEFTGGLAGSCFDQTAGQREASPGTGTDAVDSTATAATAVNGELIHGATTTIGGSTITQGTGFTSGTANYHNVSTEYLTQSSAGAATATFTSSAGVTEYTIVTTYKPVVVGGRPRSAIIFQ